MAKGKAVRGSVALTDHIVDALKEEKVVFGQPPIHRATIMSTPEPQHEAYFDPASFLHADSEYEPTKLSKLPQNRKHVDELFIGFIEQAFAKFSRIEGFPDELILAACDTFRKRGYAYIFKAGERKIPVTTLKGQVHAVVSAIDTTRHLTVLHRGEELT